MTSLSLKIVLDEGAVTRTIKFEPSTKVAHAFALIKEKFLNIGDDHEYGLFLPSTDDQRSGVWLEPHKALEHYMLRDGASLLLLHRERTLRVRMLDGAVKTVHVDESKSIGDLMHVICGKIGITNHDEYGLCHMEVGQEEQKENKPTGTLTLKRKPQKERDAKMEQLSKKLKTDDNVEWLDQHRTLREIGVDHNETLLLKRRLFYSDRNVDSRDPKQLNMLYNENKAAILNGKHPVTEEQALVCKSRWVNIRDMMKRKIRERMRQPEQRSYNYKYEDEMTFMLPFFKDNSTTSNMDYSEFVELENQDGMQADYDDVETQFDHLQNEIKPNIKALKHNSHKHEELNASSSDLNPKDPLDVFLLTIGSTLRKFSPYYLNQAKSKIFQVVQDYELQQIVNKDAQAGSSNTLDV